MDGRMWLSPSPFSSSTYCLACERHEASCAVQESRDTKEAHKLELLCTPTHRWLLLVNDFRTARVAEILSDFQNIQYYIAAAPVDPLNMDDYYTEGWATLRQCNLDGQRILNCGADTSIPETSGGPDEQAKAELKQ